MKNILCIALGGAVGSILRYILSKTVSNSIGNLFPWGTFVVNVMGCLLMGVLLGIAAKHNISTELKCLLIVGFCGGFTTFSTFAAESLSLIKGQDWISVVIYLTLSLWIGITAVWTGNKIIQML